MGKVWLCQECRTVMQHQEAGFDKCPLCGAEVWPDGEGTYQRDKRGAELGVKKHGVWYCQRCRVPMIPVDGDYCKCPECTAEIWYGKEKKREDVRELMETTEEFPVASRAGELCLAAVDENGFILKAHGRVYVLHALQHRDYKAFMCT